MANKESLQWQEALSKKISEWETQSNFKPKDRRKLNRTLNLLLSSDPEVVIDMLGGDFVPDDPREAMNLVRSLDLKTLQNMQIFAVSGLGDKLVGHHQIAGSTLAPVLMQMKPTDRLEVYKGLESMGQRYGMDPKQIQIIADKVHRSIAHGGDFKGKKTGVTLDPIPNETPAAFLKRFESSISTQLEMGVNAINAPETQRWYEAINAAEEQLELPKNTLIDPNTGMDLKKSATNLLKPTAAQVREVVRGGEDIAGGTKRILQGTTFNPKAMNVFSMFRNSINKVPGGRAALGLIPGGIGFGLNALGAVSDANAVAESATTPRTNDMKQTSRDLAGLGGVAGLLSLFSPHAAPAAIGLAGAQLAVENRVARDKDREADVKQMDPATRTNSWQDIDATITPTAPKNRIRGRSGAKRDQETLQQR